MPSWIVRSRGVIEVAREDHLVRAGRQQPADAVGVIEQRVREQAARPRLASVICRGSATTRVVDGRVDGAPATPVTKRSGQAHPGRQVERRERAARRDGQPATCRRDDRAASTAALGRQRALPAPSRLRQRPSRAGVQERGVHARDDPVGAGEVERVVVGAVVDRERGGVGGERGLAAVGAQVEHRDARGGGHEQPVAVALGGRVRGLQRRSRAAAVTPVAPTSPVPVTLFSPNRSTLSAIAYLARWGWVYS